MKARDRKFCMNLVSLAVRGALVASIAAPSITLAQDAGNDDVKALTMPTNFLQVGGEDNSKASDKFGEYNGLYKKGATFLGDFSLAGGDAYGQGSGTMRYDLSGTDLGTTSGSVNGSISDQGKWNLGFGYDELRHEFTNSYETPFQGTVGGNNFDLPSNFGVINTAYKPAGFATAPGTNDLTAQQQSDFHSDNIYSDRKNTSFTAGYRFDPQWDVKFDFNHLGQDGAKLLGVGGDQVNSPTGSTYTWAGQTPLVLPNPTDYTTDTFKFAVNWVGAKSYATLGYYGSIFSDSYSSVSWNNPFIKAPATVATGTVSAFPTDSISTFPSNMFNQLNLTGGYALPASTRIAGGISYAFNHQDDAYPGTGNIGLNPLGVPENSLHGLVEIEHLDLRLTNDSWKRLLLAAGVKFNERNNETSSNAYTYNTINEAAIQTETSVNAPMSNKKTQADVNGDFRISSRQHLSLGYEYDDTRRWCNNAAANDAQGSLNAAATGGWAAYTAATCAQVPDTKEDKLTVNYRLGVSSGLNLNAGYSYSWRKADISPTFYNPMQAVDNPAGSGASAEGYEVLGFVSFFEASRHEQMVKAGANWQPGDKLSLSLNGRYREDRYADLTYGVQDSDAASVNFDSSYSFNDRRSLSLYVTYQDSSRNLTNLYKVTSSAASATALSGTAGETWTNRLQESDTTIGAGARQDGLFSGKLNLSADLSYSLGNSEYDTSPFAGTDLEGNTCSAVYYQTCGSLPTIKNSTLRLRVNGSYQLSKAGTLIVGYTFQRLASDDYLYNAYQYGFTPATMLPTNQQSPSYEISAIYLAYRYRFR
ncbi:MAG: MtrB/PioB family decaheme-associated outer membrane protein [Steroidobacteraceae bacterium]